MLPTSNTIDDDEGITRTLAKGTWSVLLEPPTEDAWGQGRRGDLISSKNPCFLGLVEEHLYARPPCATWCSTASGSLALETKYARSVAQHGRGALISDGPI
jgi:hypothetical protein